MGEVVEMRARAVPLAGEPRAPAMPRGGEVAPGERAGQGGLLENTLFLLPQRGVCFSFI